LKTLIDELALCDHIFLLGQRSNPYPYLQKSDCFVLSSNHEGQPMTLFEALILKKPIIATNITGNRSVMEGRPGHLVENSEKGLVRGMLHFLEGDYENDEVFDYNKYNENALKMFYEKLVQ
jgi:CDP-glycerol glycerophosphotransferase